MQKRPFDYPADLKKGWEKEYIKVEKAKVRETMVIGRIYYCISSNGKIRGHGVIRPRLKKGFLVTDGDPVARISRTWIGEEENLEEYQRMNIEIIKELISNNTLYIKPTDKLVKFSYESHH